jgi:ribosomal protein S18 acetylase RimI-like enzyme
LFAADPTFRAATPADLDGLVPMAVSLARQHEAQDPQRFVLAAHAAVGHVEAAYRRFFEAQLRDPGAVVILVEVSGRLAGYAFVRLAAASFLDLSPDAGWIHDIYLVEGQRGRGLGKLLLREAISELRRLGARTIMLGVAPWNSHAQRLFVSVGFRQTMIECTLEEDLP